MNSKVTSVNPYSGEEIASFQEHSQEEVRNILNRSGAAYRNWREVSVQKRSRLLSQLAEVLQVRKEIYAHCITEEMGKPLRESLAEIEKCAWVCRYYAENAPGFLEADPLEGDRGEAYVQYDPLGVILGIMPWNYPFWQVFRFAAPTLAAGNAVLLKHASNVWKCAGLIASAFIEAGYPKDIFQVLYVSSNAVNNILENTIIQGVSLTGSTPAGAAVASKAGSLIKRSVLELGGNNAMVVFDDADFERAVDICVQARYQNSGQSCIAGKRLLLQRSVAERFQKRFCKKVESLVFGDPMDVETQISVMARVDLAASLFTQMQNSLNRGARILTGGKREGAYFEPTVLGDVVPGMPVFDEETFGPLIGISTFDTEEEALELISASDFGLGVSVFTQDRDRAARLIPKLEEGAVFINALVKSDPRWPFGGVKTSGYGRELSRQGILEFVNQKTVYIPPFDSEV